MRESDPGRAIADCALFAEVGGNSWTVSVVSGQLQVVDGPKLPFTFRLRAGLQAFNRLIASSVSTRDAEARLSRALRLDAETVRLIAAVPGALRIRVTDTSGPLDIIVGPSKADFERPSCTVTCSIGDFEDLQAERQNPMDMFLSGRLALEGDLEVAMALGGVFLT
jgi:ubiquinone biosynthesis protein UbiJ